jgi:hypothetical protein
MRKSACALLVRATGWLLVVSVERMRVIETSLYRKLLRCSLSLSLSGDSISTLFYWRVDSDQ